MTDEQICPCDGPAHPRRITNPPGLDTIDYRIGDFATFREALLRSRRGEQALREWQPKPQGDLVVQLLEWWAYIADILTAYNERALHEVLLRTAVFPEDIRRIIRLLGYRPRPGIGATGVVAAIADSPRPVVIARGFPIQASLGAGKPPQIFETDSDVELGLLGVPLPASARFPTPPGRVSSWTGYAERDASGALLNAIPARKQTDKQLPIFKAGTPVELAVKGLVTNAGAGDTVVLMRHDWDGVVADQLPGSALAVIHALEQKWDEAGLPVTVLTLHPGQTLPAGGELSQYRLRKATKLAHLWLYHERYPGMKSPSVGGVIAQVAEQIFDPGGLFSGGISHEPPQDPHALTSMMLESPWQGAAHLEAITRGIKPGDPVLFEQKLAFPGGLPELFFQMIGAGDRLADLTQQLEEKIAFFTKVTGYSELVWYANPPEPDRIGQGPPIGPPSHGLISGGASPLPIPHSRITFNDPFLRASMMSMDDLMIKTIVVHYGWQDVGELTDVPAKADDTRPEVPAHPGLPPGTPLPVIVEDATGAGVPGWVGVPSTEPGPPLAGKLRALVNLLPVSRGATVAREILGSGDATAVNQEFMLAQAPLTYLADTGPESRNGYRSTLRIRVDGIEWHEVETFYGQPQDARVFVTREDDQQRTFVKFGDGELGARLPTGVDNVVATYRFGSGADVPPIGTLTTIVKPQKGLQAVRNPIPPGGGADPDPPEQIRRYAPRSVLAFGRAISGDDYETIAAQTPGVRRAKAQWGWDAAAQRSMVKVFVGDDDAAVTAARAALRAYNDPNKPVLVALAQPIEIDVSLTIEVHPDFDASDVQAAVAAALMDPLQRPFGIEVVRIDEPLYDSEIYEACRKIAGVVAVHGLAVKRRAITPTASTMPPAAPQVPGFSRHYRVWSGTERRQSIEHRAAASPDALAPDLPRPLKLPLKKAVRQRLLALRDAAVAATLPPPEAIVVDDASWTQDPGERHLPGVEGGFFLLQGDRLHIATEVYRHGR